MSLTRRLVLVVSVSGCGLVAAGEAVIMPDGFVIQGKLKEAGSVFNPRTGNRVNKLDGFDLLENGPRIVAFSTHVRKGGKVEKGLPDQPYPVYKRTSITPRSAGPLRFPVTNVTVGPWNADWVRPLKGETPPAPPRLPNGAPVSLRQQISSLDATNLVVSCDKYTWVQHFPTCEFPPAEIRKLLATHPELKDPPGKVDPDRRLSIATFLKDVAGTDPSAGGIGWLRAARDELEKLKTDSPPSGWNQQTTKRFDQVGEEIDRADGQRLLDELAAAVASGRYGMARRIVEGYKPVAADAKQITRFAELKTQVESTLQRFEQTAELLRGLSDRESGALSVATFSAAAGGPGAQFAPRPAVAPRTAALLDGATAVRAELHPDTVGRLELFTLLAAQEDQRRRAGQPATATGDELLALAVSGWLKGKNGADKNPDAAARAWAGRSVGLAYLREPIGNNRRAVLDAHLRGGQAAGPDELAQIVTLLPPPFAAEAAESPGAAVPVADAGTDRVFRRTTRPTADPLRGSEYLIRVPAEFHPGRPYPLILALTDPEFPAEHMVGRLAEFADRFGYIVAAPVWNNQFSQKRYDYGGADEHPLAVAVLRDVLRHFPADPDRVFAWGFGNGADFALGLGMAHPDLFAGLVLNGASPPEAITVSYWRNAQKLPVYAVTGDQGAGVSSVQPLFDKWVTKGFPALLTIYKGRGIDWFKTEVPHIFDWLGRKQRVRGTASLMLNKEERVEPWQVLREADDRFYWVGVAPGGLRDPNLVANRQPGQFVTPATFRADIGRNGAITIDQVIGIRRLVIWLERDLIDWEKPVSVLINGRQPNGFRPKKMDRDLPLMFEQIHRTGDRKMLYQGMIEVDGPG